MKKIGVITFSKSLNYGAFLQAYALQTVLKNLGTEASLIDYENPVDKKRYNFFSFKTPRSTIASFIFLPIMMRRKRSFRRATKRLRYTPINTEYDIAITGSDQVWNPELLGGKLDKLFFLEGIDAEKKISYASSIGNEEMIEEKKDEYRQLINKLDAISVREISVSKKLSKIIDKPIFITADPVFLIKKEEWSEVIENKKKSAKPYVFSYFVGGIKKYEAESLAKVCERLKMDCVSYSKNPIEKHIRKYAFTDGPLDFLARLRDSKLVLTSSFHGIVLSIIFQKNFYYFLPRADKRSRIDSILKKLGLTDRIIETEDDIDKINLIDVDYTEPQKKLDEFRKESLDWLKKAIGD